MNHELCAILVNSCDKYEDCWDPFFRLFRTMWKDCPYKVYLNTEAKLYHDCEGTVETLHPIQTVDKKGKPISWSERLRQSLKAIDAKYVILLMDDFFLKSPVRDEVVTKCIGHMEENSEACYFKFFPDPCLSDIICDEFGPVNEQFVFCISLMATLWRKDYLMSLLRDEDPWDFELFASARYRNQIRQGKNCKGYSQRSGCSVFDYMFPATNGGLWSAVLRGKWLVSVPAFMESQNINIDYEKRGIIDPQFEKQSIHQKNGVANDIKDVIKHPKRLGHYVKSACKVIQWKYKQFKARFFNP